VRDRPAPKAAGTPEGPDAPGPPGAGGAPAPRIHRNVLLLGINSLLTDISSESVNAVLPIYLINTLGLSALGFGFFDGIYQGMSAILRIFGVENAKEFYVGVLASRSTLSIAVRAIITAQPPSKSDPPWRRSESRRKAESCSSIGSRMSMPL